MATRAIEYARREEDALRDEHKPYLRARLVEGKAVGLLTNSPSYAMASTEAAKEFSAVLRDFLPAQAIRAALCEAFKEKAARQMGQDEFITGAMHRMRTGQSVLGGVLNVNRLKRMATKHGIALDTVFLAVAVYIKEVSKRMGLLRQEESQLEWSDRPS